VRNRIMIYGPKEDGTYVVEFTTAWDAMLSISIPRNEAGVIPIFPRADAVWAERA
jgi:hypothetical protein